MKKQCSRCKERKTLDMYTLQSDGRYKSWCKGCSSGYARERAFNIHHTKGLMLSTQWLRKPIV